MKKSKLILEVTSLLLLLIAVIFFTLISIDIELIGSSNFDLVKWLDVDIFLWRWGIRSIIISLVIHIISFVLGLKEGSKNENT